MAGWHKGTIYCSKEVEVTDLHKSDSSSESDGVIAWHRFTNVLLSSIQGVLMYAVHKNLKWEFICHYSGCLLLQRLAKAF